MTPQEHYKEAEKLLAEYEERIGQRGLGSHVITPPILTQAQVHATLATVQNLSGEEDRA